MEREEEPQDTPSTATGRFPLTVFSVLLMLGLLLLVSVSTLVFQG